LRSSPGGAIHGLRLAPFERAPAPEAVAGLLGRPASDVVAVSDLGHPWAGTTQTLLVTLETGARVVLQRGMRTRAGRAAIARRIRLAGALRAAAPFLPVPEVLAESSRARDGPWLVTRFVDGRPGNELLGSDAEAAALGTIAGSIALAVARISPTGLRLGRLWADADRLGAAAETWMRSTTAELRPEAAKAGSALAARVPWLFAASPVAVAHGDLAPVNLLVRDGVLVALLDLERMRLAPAAFDVAWFRYVVRLHHPGRWAATGPALMAARDLADHDETARLLDDLAALACLERAAIGGGGSERRAWIERLESLLIG